jgi:hypothetical protein
MTALPASVLCFTCRQRPAGWGSWYRCSAYCRNCQPQPDLDNADKSARWRQDWLRDNLREA